MTGKPKGLCGVTDIRSFFTAQAAKAEPNGPLSLEIAKASLPSQGHGNVKENIMPPAGLPAETSSLASSPPGHGPSSSALKPRATNTPTKRPCPASAPVERCRQNLRKSQDDEDEVRR